jgi:hypothetical protein
VAGYLYPRQAWHGPALCRVQFLVGGVVDGFDLTRTTGVTFAPTRTPLPFVAVISEGPGPIGVTAYDEAGTTLDPSGIGTSVPYPGHRSTWVIPSSSGWHVVGKSVSAAMTSSSMRSQV